MQQLITQVKTYLSAVFAGGSQLVLTAFDILGLFVFIFPTTLGRMVANEGTARGIGLAILAGSFILANINAYRSLLSKLPTQLSPAAIEVYPNLNYPLNGAEFRYFAREPAKRFNLEVRYTSFSGELRIGRATHFYTSPKQDGFPQAFNVLEPDQVLYFDLPSDCNAKAGPVEVHIMVTGAYSGTSVDVTRSLTL